MLISNKYNKVEYRISTVLDSSGLDNLQKKIAETQKSIQEMASKNLIDPSKAREATDTISKLQTSLANSFNGKFNQVDASKFLDNLKASGTSLSQVQKSLAAGGASGQAAFNNIVAEVSKVNTGLKTTSTLSDKLFTSMKDVAGWQIVSGVMNRMTDSFSQALDYVKELDDSLTQIMLVTDNSRENMNAFAKSANEAAKSLGTTTTAMTNASLVFAQQGFSNDQSLQMANLSTLLANASQQDTATTSDQITAYMNAYGLSGDMATLKKALNAWAEVANVSAADVGEIAQASQRVASTAKTTGVTMDQLNAQIATIESVTREAPKIVWALAA